jgi:hypothetical protein
MSRLLPGRGDVDKTHRQSSVAPGLREGFRLCRRRQPRLDRNKPPLARWRTDVSDGLTEAVTGASVARCRLDSSG